MNDLIQKLPTDVIQHILSYTYCPQNKNLLVDLANYTETKEQLLDLYYDFWVTKMQEFGEDKNWLINDIFGFANNEKPTMCGYVDNFYNIFKRNIFLQTNEKIDKYVYNLEKKPSPNQINIFLGLLTVNERNDFLHNSYCSYNEL
jgi:hypothetical protein